MDADFAADASLQVDFTPSLVPLDPQLHFHEVDAVDRTNLEARFAPGAVIGIDNRQSLGELFAGSLLCHEEILKS